MKRDALPLLARRFFVFLALSALVPVTMSQSHRVSAQNGRESSHPKSTNPPTAKPAAEVAFVRSQAKLHPKALTSDQQLKFLSTRLPSGVIMGPFGPWGSFLMAVMQVAIHTDDPTIGNADLNSPFPDFYKPTWRELFDTIADQTQSSWKYDPGRDYWVFAKPKAPKPFAITIADKWSSDDRDIYVSYHPPAYRVGMDIYSYGSYSADDPKDEAVLWEKVRNSWAIGFASRLKEGVSIAEMQKVKVAGVEALYFESPAPLNGLFWRQWAFVKEGKAFVIVSSLLPKEQQLFAEVQAMIKSFRVVPTH